MGQVLDTLATHAVELHLCVPARQTRADIERAWSMLDSEERARANGFLFEDDRRAYIVAHGLLRSVVAHHTEHDAAALRFQCTPFGRPELDPPWGSTKPALRFSLSHTRCLVGCALTLEHDIGFDLEQSGGPAPLEVAEQYFAAEELAALRSMRGPEQQQHFYRLWTLKEAYSKGLGLGLSLPFESFAIELLPGGAVHLGRQPLQHRSSWSLGAWPVRNHWAALALRAASVPDDIWLFKEQQISSIARSVGEPLLGRLASS